MELKAERGICILNQVRAAGLRSDRYGLGLALIDSQTRSLGLFTSNRLRSCSSKLAKLRLRRNPDIRCVMINSGCANTFTGAQGIKDARYLTELAAELLGLRSNQVILLSTGIIGPRLNLDLISSQVRQAISKLESSARANLDFARAIMTTDRYPKYCELIADQLKLGGVVKGAGMIHPGLGTMICLIVTNADLSLGKLRTALNRAAEVSFNQISVDRDRSTNDSLILISCPQVAVELSRFRECLTQLCIQLAKSIAFDGEGSTKKLEVMVKGACSNSQARSAARAIVSSNLVKCSIHGAAPSWGRILAALGNSGAEFRESRLELWVESELGRAQVIESGKIKLNPELGSRLLSGNQIKLILDLGMGSGSGMAWGCDLSPEYVKLNAELS